MTSTIGPQEWGGSWEHWFVNNGTFNATAGTPPNCTLSTPQIPPNDKGLMPNPFDTHLSVYGLDHGQLSLYNLKGRLIFYETITPQKQLDTQKLAPGIYIASFEGPTNSFVQKLIKR